MLLLAIVHMLFGSGYYTAVAKVPKFFTEQRCGDARAVPVDVFAGRSTSRRIGQVRWVKEGSPREFYCIPRFVPGAETSPRGEVPLMEDGYEEAAFVVVERAGSWARIRLDRGTGWIHLAKDDEVVPYEDLVLNRMAELTPAWDGRIAAQPGGVSRSFAHTKSRSVRVLESRRIGGVLWFRIRVTDGECSAHEPRELASGWIRAYSSKREPTVRHFSRGC